MGKGILFTTTAVLLIATSVFVIGEQSAFDTKQEQVGYEKGVLAREAAQSGFGRALSSIKLELMDTPTQFTDVSVGDSEYDLQITTNHYGDLNIASTGAFGDTNHAIEGNVIFAFPSSTALRLSADQISPTSNGNYLISGEDQRAPSVSNAKGYLSPSRGLLTNSLTNETALLAALSASQVLGDGGSGGVTSGSISTDTDLSFYETLYEAALASGALTTLTAPFTGSYGSANDPQILYVNGDFNPTGSFSGHGLLIVDNGNVDISGSFQWEGLVLARKPDGEIQDVILNGNTQVHGSLAAYQHSDSESPECEVPFTIDEVETIPSIPVKIRVEVLGAAISYGGTYDLPVTSKLILGDSTETPWGPYNLALDGNVNTTGTFVFEPSTTYPAGTSFTVSGQSWIRADGTDGTSNSHWSVHLEQDSEMNGNLLETLRDGSPVPNVDGYLDQASAAEFVAAYIGDDGTMSMGQNQSIYLFELGETDLSSTAYDLQDLVVIVSMKPADEVDCTFPEDTPGTMNFAIGGNVDIQYSTEALAKLGKLFTTVESGIKVVLTEKK